ncbi:MAG: FliH/SctL family protein [Planctomycetota bacterium]|nr:FliH/SctL family protein [Planctomycetota bacterium]
MNDTTHRAPEPKATGRGGTLVRGLDAQSLDPLFPTTRLVRQAAQRAQQLNDEAHRTLAEATRQAQQLIAAAEARAAEIEARAAQEAKIHAAGKLNELMASIESTVRSWTEEQSTQLAHTAARLAGTILRSELTRAPERISELAAQTLARARHETVAALEMHPDDAMLAQESMQELAAAARYSGGLRIVANPALVRGSDRLHTTQGVYDGSLSTRLAELERLLSGSSSQSRTV